MKTNRNYQRIPQGGVPLYAPVNVKEIGKQEFKPKSMNELLLFFVNRTLKKSLIL